MADFEKQIPFNPELNPDQYEHVPYDQDPVLLGIVNDSSQGSNTLARDLRLRLQAWEMQNDMLARQPDNELYRHMADMADNEVANFLQRWGINRSIRLKEPPEQ